MAGSISQNYISNIEPHGDALYALALAAAGDPSRAEGLLQQLVRSTFLQFAKGSPPADFAAWQRRELAAAAARAGYAPPPDAPPPAPLPADTWARLVAAVQLEAAGLGGHKALNPDSILLSPDPLLAPKKPRAAADEPFEGFNLSPTSRFIIAVVMALVIGIALTIYLTTRRSPLPPVPATSTAPAAPATTLPTP